MNMIKNKWIGAVAAIGAGAAMIAAGFAGPKAEVGQKAPDFTLTDLDGKEHTLSSFTEDGKVVVLEWFSPSCPFVKKHYREDTGTMNTLASEFADQGVVWIRVNSAKPSHPSAALAANREAVSDWGITGPILMDPTGEVGQMYGAKRTPEMYIITNEGVLAYHGAIDDDRGARNAGDTNYVRNALQEVLAGETVTVSSTEAYGCSVKY